jgi:iron complex outermembrane receptor protein
MRSMLAVGGTLLLSAPPTLGQQALERVEVTGSAIKRIDAETAVPVTIIRIDELKAQGITTVEQVMSRLSAVQMQVGSSQSIAAGYGGAAFADLRGIGANKTLVLLNGRRIANNALDSAAPDLNTIPFAALDRVEVLRDGASALYGTDAIGGVINFITRKDFTGGTVTVGAGIPQHSGGKTASANIGFGIGKLHEDGFNVFGFLDIQKQDHIGGTQRPFNTRVAGGLSQVTSPANYYQDGLTGNPAGPGCTSAPNLIPSSDAPGCLMSTSVFNDYVPKSERVSGMLEGTLRLNADHRLGLSYFATRSKVWTTIGPVPYGGLYMNPLRPDGTPNTFYPGNAGSGFTPNITLDPTYTEGDPATRPAGSAGLVPGLQPGFVHAMWRDLPNGVRRDENTNAQQRLLATLEGTVGAWDYQAGAAYNENKVGVDLIGGYSDGALVAQGVLDGVINPFGNQTAAGTALLDSANATGTLVTAKGRVWSADLRGSRELGDWFGAGRAAALALGGEARHESFEQHAHTDFAQRVVASSGIDPSSRKAGARDVVAAYAELNVPILETFDVTGAIRYDRYSDFGSTTNPKLSFRFQPTRQVLVRGSYSTGFRAPSLYEINAGQSFSYTSPHDDPVNCPSDIDGDHMNDPIPGKTASANCNQQFQALYGGNKKLKPEKSRNATLGIVFEPTKDVSFGIDLWWVRVRQTIGSLFDGTVFADPATFASVFHRNPGGDLSTAGTQCPDPATCGYVDLRTQNLGGVNSSGVDLSARWQLRGSRIGTVDLGLQSTCVSKYDYQDIEGGPWYGNVGVFSGLGPIFRWQHNISVLWRRDQVSAGAAGHYKSGYADVYPDNHVASHTTWDIFGSYRFSKAFAVTAGVRNLFDRAPPFSNQDYFIQAGYDPRFYDPVGRTVYLRASVAF